MDDDADLCIPLGQLLSQRSAAGDEGANPAAHAIPDLGEDEAVGEPPGRRRRPPAGEHLVPMLAAHGDGPVVNPLLEAGGDIVLHLVVDLFVDAGHGDEKGGMKLAQDAGHVVDDGTVGDGDAAVEFGKIHMARRDVRERQEADRQVALHTEFKGVERDGEIGGDVAVGEHGALGNAGGAAGVDDGGQIVRGDCVGQGVQLRHALRGTGVHERGHGERGQIRGRLVHEDDVFDLGFLLDGAQLGQLRGGGDKRRFGAGVAQKNRDLPGGERGVDGHGDGAGEQDGEVGDGPLGAIFGQDGDAIVVADAVAAELLNDPHDPAVEAGGGDGLPLGIALEEHDAGLVALHDLEEDVDQGPWLGLRVHAPSLYRVIRRAYVFNPT